MAEPDNSVITEIQETYVPFLKKLIAFLEKTKKASPDNLSRLNSIYTIFTTASESEQIETFHANKEKLEKWHQKIKVPKISCCLKRTLAMSDDSSQGNTESVSLPNKRSTFRGALDGTSAAENPKIAPIKTIPLSQIKKEKMDPPKKVEALPIVQATKTVPPAVTPKPVEAPTPTPEVINDPNSPITFTCASCQFQTLDETEFMKHARTDHRTDLSMWCKLCGKCFSNAGVLVSHIKERACIREEMIYRCGVKECTFETPSGQTFVHHLRHCHKGSPFIFCVHCQKIFTLPHCLILHMQDDCPFKVRNRKGASGSSEGQEAPKITAPTPVPSAAVKPQLPVISSIVSKPSAVVLPKPVTSSALVKPTPSPIAPIQSGRGRGFGRGRGLGARRGRRPRIPSESSDSDDPDDPSWQPEETQGSMPLRRSGRWAKKVNDAVNAEMSTEESAPNKNISIINELSTQQMLHCPCCDFMAAFQSVLEDHYIAVHKVSNKNACLVCNLKFENTKSFLEHFDDHQKGKLPNTSNKPVAEAVNVGSPISAAVVDSSSNSSSDRIKTSENVVENIADSEGPVKTFSLDNVIPDGVVKNISEANLTDPTSVANGTIPYQAAIHDKNKKESKLKTCEELKSANDLIAMKSAECLKNFFKCVLYNCTFVTNDAKQYSEHLDSKHSGKRFHCFYCFKECFSGEALSNHTLVEHNKRKYQCSNCFYRGYSKIHVQIHIKSKHADDAKAEIYTCEEIAVPNSLKKQETVEQLETTWPFVCGVGGCSFNTFDPKEFKMHNETVHRTVSVFFCHYCKVDFISFKRLLNHYRLHGINTYQCSYCIHGAETNEEMMLHLCNDHADLPLKAFMRGSKDDASAEAMQLSVKDGNTVTDSNKADTVTAMVSEGNKGQSVTDLEKQFFEIVNEKFFPKNLMRVCTDFPCGIPRCEEKIVHLDLYIDHLRKVHAAVNYYCPHCPTLNETFKDFIEHLKCHGPNLYACGSKECMKYFSDETSANQHKKLHTAENVEVIVIRLNSKIDTNDFDKLKSVDKAPDQFKEDTFVCPFCKYKCDNYKIMKNHIYNELAYKRFSCNYCTVKCVSNKEMSNHFSSVHAGFDIKCTVKRNSKLEGLVKMFLEQKDKISSSKIIFRCNICSQDFRSEMGWQNHLYMCVRKEYRPYDCEHCKAHFSNLKLVKYHCDIKHFPKIFQYTISESIPVEDEINANLMEIRLKHLKDICSENNLKIEETKDASVVKRYKCNDCSFEATYKFHVEKHIESLHKNAAVVKLVQKLNSSENMNSHLDENSNDSLKSPHSNSGGDKVKRYRCGFCIKKMYTIDELKNHVEGLHPVKDETEYFYYYSPDTKSNFSEEDKESFECAYCKSSKENLFSLKKHSNLMHSDMPFKVKGYIIRNMKTHSYLACGHCYLRVDSNSELKKHYVSCHPGLPQKAIGNLRGSGTKRAYEEFDEAGRKRIRFLNNVFVCSHCGGAFSSLEQIKVHSKQAHSRLVLEYRQVSQDSAEEDAKFYKCEFCQFISTNTFLEKHLSTKHKTRVTCFYCKKRFEFATKLKEHHDVFHKELPVKYCQETVSMAKQSSLQDTRITIPSKVKSPSRKDSFDLKKITVQMETKDGHTSVPAAYFADLFNIFPKVILEDVRKDVRL
ncbi:zinc finger protein 521-like [Uloborus diversus]|uniref:zinc finger protein 521-like n=1 Tax=Uloborus diversus TaxID=327109 RepID=UPI00240928DA|nr:zinc finger protein 521-like [Uloborus diversus]